MSYIVETGTNDPRTYWLRRKTASDIPHWYWKHAMTPKRDGAEIFKSRDDAQLIADQWSDVPGAWIVQSTENDVKMTPAQKNALVWLYEHGADGMFNRHGVLLASGETAPFMRSTWNALRDLGYLEYYAVGMNITRVKIKGSDTMNAWRPQTCAE